ncbi:DUF975 family protein [Flavicella sp.]|uniref:DUF975 family protein n=1 Tax=Flavicella sp. TaxID=2957742 RepID=UPI00301658B0
MYITELMKSSKEALEGKWSLVIGTFSVFLLLSFCIQIIAEQYPIMAIVSLVISGSVGVGLSKFSLRISRNEEASFENYFSGFSNFSNSFLAFFLKTIIVVGGLLLFIVPGVIATTALGMTYFILSEDDSISATDALKKSHEMMEGHKMEYFFLFLRYLGLGILCVFTLGIGLFWLLPYIYVSNAKFYDQIKDEISIEFLT